MTHQDPTSPASPVTLLATGGTIASTRVAGKVVVTQTAADLAARAGSHLTVEPVDVCSIGSRSFTGALVERLCDQVRYAFTRGARGVVVTHGTDAIEDLAWACDLLLGDVLSFGAVVFTCAMQPADAERSDGPANLRDAISAAHSPASAGKGTLLCANGELHYARWVVKTHTTGVDTFSSHPHQTAGSVTGRNVEFHSPPPSRLPQAHSLDSKGVGVVVSHWDVDPGVIDWYLQRDVRGLVVQGVGAGNVNAVLVPGILRALRGRVPVVVSSRCAYGEVTPIYGDAGGFASLVEQGAISSGGLSTGKARLTLAAALASGTSPREIPQWFPSSGSLLAK